MSVRLSRVQEGQRAGRRALAALAQWRHGPRNGGTVRAMAARGAQWRHGARNGSTADVLTAVDGGD